MATSLGEGKLWIQTSCRVGERWDLPGYFCLRHTIGVAPPWPNQITGPVIKHLDCCLDDESLVVWKFPVAILFKWKYFWWNTGLWKHSTLYIYQICATFLFSKLKFISEIKFENTISKKSFRGALTQGKLAERSVLHDKWIILKKKNVLFMVHFCLGNYSFSLDISWMHLMYNFL